MIGRSWVNSTSAIGPSRVERVFGGDGHRLLGKVAAGANDRPPDGRHQQVMQRRVGQHQAQVGIAGGNAGEGRGERGESRGMAVPSQQDDRRLMGAERVGFSCVSWQYCRTSFNAGNIRANGRSGRRLRFRNRVTASTLVGIDQQLKAAEPFDRHHSAGEHGFHGPVERAGPTANRRPVLSNSSSAGPQFGQAIGWA